MDVLQNSRWAVSAMELLDEYVWKGSTIFVGRKTLYIMAILLHVFCDVSVL